MMFTRSTLVAAGFFLTANAHLFISSPTPIEGTAIKDPLTFDGSNFPCHGVSLPGSGGQSMAVGSSQNLIFDVGTVAGNGGDNSKTYVGGGNTAVHGGGSCQISITYETDAEKIKQASAWKVIYSIEEGCPTNSLLNLDSPQNYTGPLGMYTNAIHCDDEHANGFECVNTFNFTIPEGVKNGQATLAWTWFNTVGNREIYMNCVAIDITGGSDDSTMTDFPDIFLANLGELTNKRNTTEEQNVKFPSPGKYVTTKTATTTYTSGGAVMTVTSVSSYPLVIPSAFASSGGSSESASASYSATPTSYSASASSAAVPASYAAVPTSESSAAAAATTLATLTDTASTASASSYSSGSASSSNSTTGTCTDGRVSCSSPGGVICIGSTQFGICNTDHCAVPQDLAAGTDCSSGVIAKRAAVDVVRRRSSRLQRHVAGLVHKNQF